MYFRKTNLFHDERVNKLKCVLKLKKYDIPTCI